MSFFYDFSLNFLILPNYFPNNQIVYFTLLMVHFEKFKGHYFAYLILIQLI